MVHPICKFNGFLSKATDRVSNWNNVLTFDVSKCIELTIRQYVFCLVNFEKKLVVKNLKGSPRRNLFLVNKNSNYYFQLMSFLFILFCLFVCFFDLQDVGPAEISLISRWYHGGIASPWQLHYLNSKAMNHYNSGLLE